MPNSSALCPHCNASHPLGWTHCPTTGGSLGASSLVGNILADRYRLIGLIGEGGMGTVFEAVHIASARRVAVKRLHPGTIDSTTVMARFQREAKVASATGHANVVELLDVGFDAAGAPYLVMELLKGQTLAKRLQHGPLEQDEAVEIACQVLSALEAVHGAGVVHRDLKPANIFLTRAGVKLLDFGISKFSGQREAGDTLTRTGATVGTPLYMSPEQARGSTEIDHRADLYSLGVVLYESLAGHRPHASTNYHALLREIIDGEIPRLGLNVSSGLAEVVYRTLASDPGARFQSASRMLEALSLYRPTSRRIPLSVPPPAPGPSLIPDPPEPLGTTPGAIPKTGPFEPEQFDHLGAAVKGRFVQALSRTSDELRGRLEPLGVTLPLTWVEQSDLEAHLAGSDLSDLRDAGSLAAMDLLERLGWPAAPLPRLLARIPALHRSFFSGNDLRVEGESLLWVGEAPGPFLAEVIAGFYEAAIRRGGGRVHITGHPERLLVAPG